MGDATDRSDDEPLASGTQIGRYTIVDVVGQGGMGVVYRAHDRELDRTVALKMLRRRGNAGEAKSRFLREARAMAALSSEYVVQVFDADVHGDDAFIAMEFVDGTTLRLWQPQQPLPARLRAYLAAGRGLLAAHRQGLVHRDFKPDNVLVGDDGRVLVTDFGIARALQATPSAALDSPITTSAEPIDDNAGLTGDGTVIGTPGYMPPEQYRGHPTDARSDQYAFGIALYESLYGTRPFSGRTPRELYAKVARGLPAAPEGDTVPRSIRASIARAVAPSREARHPTLEPVLNALERATGDRTRRYVWLGLGTVGVLAAVGVGAGAGALGERKAGCDGARRMSEVWTSTKRDEAARAFEHSRPRYGADTWGRLERKVDDYAGTWSTAFDHACASSDDLIDARMGCLQERLEVFGSLVDVLATADGAVVEHRIGQHLQRRGDLTAITGQETQRCRQPPAGTRATDRDPVGIHARQPGQPGQHPVAVLQRNRVGVLGRKSIAHRGDSDAESLHVPPAQRIVMFRTAEQVTAAVDPQQRRGGRRRGGGPVQPRPGTAG